MDDVLLAGTINVQGYETIAWRSGLILWKPKYRLDVRHYGRNIDTSIPEQTFPDSSQLPNCEIGGEVNVCYVIEGESEFLSNSQEFLFADSVWDARVFIKVCTG